jgi:hypothetical protein
MPSRANRLLRSLYLLPLYRGAIVRLRLFYFVHIRKALRTFSSQDAFPVTVAHNLKSLAQCNPRIDLLIKPLSVLELVDENSEVLVIGPRNEHDLFTLYANGFAKGRVRGLDLISYSPLIDLGDMHSTPYPNDRWDVIIVGWTLSYSSSPAKFAEELTRIAKDGALIAIAVEYSTLSESDEVQLSGYSIQERARLKERINSVQDILDLFSSRAGHVFFSHDAPLKRSHGKDGLIPDVSSVGVIFRLTK